MMDCNTTLPLLPLSVDGELDARDEASVAAHLEHCESCSAQRARLESLSASVRTAATYHHAPASLRARLVAAMPQPAKPRRPWYAGWRTAGPGWRLAGAGFVAAAAAAVVLVVQRPSLDQGIVDELVASHVRAQLGNHAIDIASTDQHTVKPWFRGKLDFSPTVVDLADQGFSLQGGRLDYLRSRPVAALVFRRRQHVIDVYEWPERSPSAPSAPSRIVAPRGYAIIGWTAGGLEFRAISDLDPGELRQFVDGFQAAGGGHPGPV